MNQNQELKRHSLEYYLALKYPMSVYPEEEGIVVEQKTTNVGQEFKVDWLIPNTNNVILRTIWEIKKTKPNPRLISAFIK